MWYLYICIYGQPTVRDSVMIRYMSKAIDSPALKPECINSKASVYDPSL